MPQSRHRKTTKARKRPGGRAPSTTRAPLGNKNRSLRIVAIAVVAVLALSAVGYVLSRRGNQGTEVTTASGLKYVDLVEGTGAGPEIGQTVSVNYVGTLENGTKFDSSYDRNTPFQFIIGSGSVIKGWDEGIKSMKVGGKRKLIIPSALGYGTKGSPPKIPPNSTLLFEVELLNVK